MNRWKFALRIGSDWKSPPCIWLTRLPSWWRTHFGCCQTPNRAQPGALLEEIDGPSWRPLSLMTGMRHLLSKLLRPEEQTAGLPNQSGCRCVFPTEGSGETGWPDSLFSAGSIGYNILGNLLWKKCANIRTRHDETKALHTIHTQG